ncbi:MAG: hypothetical protein AAF805_12675, partial [Planctomycetota bacterium]
MSDLRQAFDQLAAEHHAERCPVDLGAVADDRSVTPATLATRRRRRALVAVAVAASIALWVWPSGQEAGTPGRNQQAANRGKQAAGRAFAAAEPSTLGLLARVRRVSAAGPAATRPRPDRPATSVATAPLALRSRRWATGPLAPTRPRPSANASALA